MDFVQLVKYFSQFSTETPAQIYIFKEKKQWVLYGGVAVDTASAKRSL